MTLALIGITEHRVVVVLASCYLQSWKVKLVRFDERFKRIWIWRVNSLWRLHPSAQLGREDSTLSKRRKDFWHVKFSVVWLSGGELKDVRWTSAVHTHRWVRVMPLWALKETELFNFSLTAATCGNHWMTAHWIFLSFSFKVALIKIFIVKLSPPLQLPSAVWSVLGSSYKPAGAHLSTANDRQTVNSWLLHTEERSAAKQLHNFLRSWWRPEQSWKEEDY